MMSEAARSGWVMRGAKNQRGDAGEFREFAGAIVLPEHHRLLCGEEQWLARWKSNFTNDFNLGTACGHSHSGDGGP